MIDFNYSPEFEKDLKKLKRFRSLKEDMANLKKALTVCPGSNPPISVCVTKLESKKEIIKVRKFACKALKGRGAMSGIRLIYLYDPEQATILFIEIYFKGDKENEDRDRLQKYC